VDRAKNGCKRHIFIDAAGVPMLIQCTPANVRDDVPFIAMLDSLPPVRKPAGPPKYKPDAVVGDAGYGFDHIIVQVKDRRIESMLAPRSKPGKPATHGSGLGKVRYFVERTLAWLNNFRRIMHCFERTGPAWQGFNDLACCVINAGKLKKLNRATVAA
jgi:transposase